MRKVNRRQWILNRLNTKIKKKRRVKLNKLCFELPTHRFPRFGPPATTSWKDAPREEWRSLLWEQGQNLLHKLEERERRSMLINSVEFLKKQLFSFVRLKAYWVQHRGIPPLQEQLPSFSLVAYRFLKCNIVDINRNRANSLLLLLKLWKNWRARG